MKEENSKTGGEKEFILARNGELVSTFFTLTVTFRKQVLSEELVLKDGGMLINLVA